MQGTAGSNRGYPKNNYLCNMKPKKIILIRHAESEGNADRSMYATKPDYALELSKKGIAQSENAGRELREIIKDESAFFYVSPFFRTRMTFEGIAKALDLEKIKWIEEPRLREQEWGHLHDANTSGLIDMQRDAYGTFYYRIQDGESAADVYDRVSDFFGTLHRDFEKADSAQNVIIVTHGMTLRLFLMRWFHWTVEQFEEIANPKNCEMVVLEMRESGKYKLEKPMAKHEVKHKYQRPIKLSE